MNLYKAPAFHRKINLCVVFITHKSNCSFITYFFFCNNYSYFNFLIQLHNNVACKKLLPAPANSTQRSPSRTLLAVRRRHSPLPPPCRPYFNTKHENYTNKLNFKQADICKIHAFRLLLELLRRRSTTSLPEFFSFFFNLTALWTQKKQHLSIFISNNCSTSYTFAGVS